MEYSVQGGIIIIGMQLWDGIGGRGGPSGQERRDQLRSFFLESYYDYLPTPTSSEFAGST